MELTAKTVDEDPASCKRWISGMASRIVTKKIHVVLNQLYSSLWTSRSWFLIKEHWVEIYSNQKAINCILPSNIRANVQTRPPKLPNLLQFSPTSIPDILWFGSVLKAVSPDLFFTSTDSAEVVFMSFLLTIYESFQLA